MNINYKNKIKYTILLGATGFLGQYLLFGLIKQGFHVIVITRSNQRESTKQRISKIFKNNRLLNDTFRLQQSEFYDSLTLLDGDITQEKFGLSPHDYLKLLGIPITAIWNAAAFMKYSFKHENETLCVNVEAVEKLLDLTLQYNSCVYYHISTAFLFGEKKIGDESICEKFYELPDKEHYTNCYCYSKLLAENIIRNHHKKHRTSFVIFRPSIIIGDSKTGFTSTRFGFYEFLIPAIKLQKKLKKGILRIYGDLNAEINMIPVDICAEYMLNISQIPNSINQIYNLIDTTPLTFKQVVLMYNDIFDVQFIPNDYNMLILSQLTTVEKLLYRATKNNRVFSNTNFKFDATNTIDLIREKPFQGIAVNKNFHQKIWGFQNSNMK